MKTVKMFTAKEIEKAINLTEGFGRWCANNYIDIANDSAIRWYVDVEEEPTKEDDEDTIECIKVHNAINQYMLSCGAKIDELVYIDITW